MALTATIYSFEIQLSDVDRGVYEALAFKAAQHPSESDEYFVTRVLAYCLEYHEGIAFSKGLAEPDDPALAVRDLTGAIQTWIEIGSPSAERLHKASKATPRVVVYTHKNAAQLVRQLDGERIHRRETIEIRAVDRELVDQLAARLERRMSLGISVTDGHLYVTVGDATLEGSVERVAIGPSAA
ncbi:MAG TPA: YaeQ family protein [Gemmatimonadaceae bacterium]|nr:YaeQ family protein [Gemmatimonadaceae bacterium]